MNHPTSRWLKAATLLMATAPASLFTSAAAAQDQLWLRQFGTSGRDQINALVPDGAGGVVFAGITTDSLAAQWLGGRDVILGRYDDAGNQLWIRQFGTHRNDYANALAVADNAGGVMVAGETSGNLGANDGGLDAFVARYDAAGEQLWIDQFGSASRDLLAAAAPDGEGGALVAGLTWGDIAGPSEGNIDGYLARYNAKGRRLWVRQFGSVGSEWVRAIASDDVGGAYVGGITLGSFGGPNFGEQDAFLTRYDAHGHGLWVRQLGSIESDQALALCPDGAGGVMLAGSTLGDWGGPSGGLGDVVLARFDSAGNQLWIRQFGSVGSEGATALAPDNAGGVFVAGLVEGALGGPNLGFGKDIFLARFDGAGNRLWLRQFGTAIGDHVTALASDGDGGVFIGGYTWGNWGGPNLGVIDAWIARYSGTTCYADCDHSTGNGVLDIFDFLCWQNDFVTGNSYACDCDTSTGPLVCDMLDFLCFQNAFVAGCP